jgi:hypothetical protein
MECKHGWNEEESGLCALCIIEQQQEQNSRLSALLSSFTEADKREINNLDARLKRHGFSWQNTDYITLQDIIPKLKALIDLGR